MDRERYREINRLADAALELTPRQRVIFLERACAGDEELRRQVERLLLAHESNESALDRPALELLALDMASLPGEEETLGRRKVARYEVRSRLGAGGHGEVWLGYDSQLGREVALKVLFRDLACHPEYVRRFQKEARASSSLNHPNIVTIYEIGVSEGLHFIAQEFVAGETLRQELARGPLPVERAVRVAAQVAAALEAAHGAGLVHRDIKPENVIVRPDGLVKVLDFGLARFLDQRKHGGVAVTQAGTVLGTLKYMSPEQARGLEVDSRSDIFSLGAVLYELVAGKAAFAGSSDSDIIAAILKEKPAALVTVVPAVPDELDRVVQLCLEKEPPKRYQDAGALRRKLESLLKALEATPRIRRNTVFLTLSALFLVTAAGVGIYYVRTKTQNAPQNSMRIGVMATRGGAVSDATISPDGKLVAYLLDEGEEQSLWLKAHGAASDVRLAGPESGGRRGLTFSADGKYLFYIRRESNAHDSLYRQSLSGGPATMLLRDVNGSMAFSRDGRQFAFVRLNSEQGESSLMVADADGRNLRAVARRRRPEYFSVQGLAWSPQGRSIAGFAGNASYYASDAFRLFEFQLEDGSAKQISSRTWARTKSLLWSADGKNLIFAAGERANELLQVWLLRYADGSVRRITNDLNNYTEMGQTADSKTLVALQSSTSQEIWITPTGDFSHARRISSGSLRDLNTFAWLPDGRIALSALSGEARNLWSMDADGNNLRQLTTGPQDKDEVAATPDGRYLLYQSQGKIWRLNSDGSDLRQLTRGSLDVHPDVSSDGRWVVYASFRDWSPDVGGLPALWRVSIDGGEAVQVTTETTSMPRVSPDGRFIACLYFPGGDPRYSPRKMAVIPFEGGPNVKAFDVTYGMHNQVEWAADGTALYYVASTNGAGNIWRQPLVGGVPVRVTSFEEDDLFYFTYSAKEKRFAVSRGKSVNEVVTITDFSE